MGMPGRSEASQRPATGSLQDLVVSGHCARVATPDAPRSLEALEEILHCREDRITAQVRIPRVGRPGNLPREREKTLRLDHAAAQELLCIQKVLAETTDDLRQQLRIRIVVKEVDVADPVDEQMALGEKFQVRGTPAIILDNGKMLPGYLPAARIAMQFDQ